MTGKSIIILGASGSIGRQTLDCIDSANRRVPGSFTVRGISVRRNSKALDELSQRYPYAKTAILEVSGDTSHFSFTGKNAVGNLIEQTQADLVLNAIAGSEGLAASISVLCSGKLLALANKESVVMGYRLLDSLARRHKTSIVPVDSEHSALFQLFQRIGSTSIRELTITASGGPFLNYTPSQLATIRAEEAAKHPVWSMGRKISIDSATLANKGLELIEAVRLFGVPEDRVKVLIHPQSIVHALVRTIDGALYAHMTLPDMRLPIEYALNWPEEKPTNFPSLDLRDRTLMFSEPDISRFPLLDLARHAVREGEAGTIAYNAADEVAVAAFEQGMIGFPDIACIISKVLEDRWNFLAGDIDSILGFDLSARSKAKKAVMEFAR